MRRDRAWWDLPGGLRLILALSFLIGLPAASGKAAPSSDGETFQTIAPFALLVDAATGTVLFEKNADAPMLPASTTKILTAEVVFRELKEGRLSLDDKFRVSEHAWRDGGAPSGGSAMFLQPNIQVRVEDLIRGLVIDSGNDAAITLAEGIAGSEEQFARRMNERARAIGMAKSSFTNPWGRGDPGQSVTARDMVTLAGYVISTYPDLYRYFGERDFTWDKLRQLNRNPLLTMNIGADGLKTGDLTQSGYGIVASAVQRGERLILVLNGLRTGRDRANEAAKLLDWGFRSFEPKQLYAAGETVGSATVYGGAAGEVPLMTEKAVAMLVPRGSDQQLSGKIVYDGPLPAPVVKGMAVGQIKIFRGGSEIFSAPLRTAEAVGKGTLTQRAWDAGHEFLTTLVRQNFTRH